MKYDAVKNPNYVATVVAVHKDLLRPLDGLDNLVGYTKFGMQALVSKDTPTGLYLLFSTEVQLSPDFARANNLYRDAALNADPGKVGYLEQNRRVKAIKLRGHRSESLLMPLDSLSYMLPAKDLASMREGDVFDSIGGREVCCKYLVRQPATPGKAKGKVRALLDVKAFPEHMDSEAYFRNAQRIPGGAPVVVSQKLHGTSVRYGNVPVPVEQSWWERLLRRPCRSAHRFVVGSRRLVKSIDLRGDDGQAHYFDDGDLWTRYAAERNLDKLIPKDHIVYGELVGFAGPGSPIQKGYTYDQPDGTARLYVYRVAVITADGRTVDYSPEQMETFCIELGLSAVPVLWAGLHRDFEANAYLERRFYDMATHGVAFLREPVPLSEKKAVDEGVCIRYDGPFGPYIVKAKSPSFLVFESKALDAGVEDVEATENEAAEAAA